MSVEHWWQTLAGPELAQGDYLRDCIVPIMPAGVVQASDANTVEDSTYVFEAQQFDLIIVTQSCDLENGKARLVATCPIFSVAEYESANPTLKNHWESVRQGRHEGLHLLAAPDYPQDNRRALVVNFRQIFSLPVEYLAAQADGVGERSRLRSPYLEHFSQGFARFFMRVGLPGSIPPFK